MRDAASPSPTPAPPLLASSGAQVRERLLDAAERLFAELGYAATSVRDITAEAGCNLAAVNYYFGGKANLYREAFLRGVAGVREQRIEALRAAMEREPWPQLEDVLGRFAAAFLAPLDGGRGPTLFQLWMREQIDPQLPPETFAAEMVLPIRRALGAALQRLVPTLSERDATLCIQSFVAQLANLFHLRRHALPRGAAGTQASTADQIRHIAAFTAAGIEAVAAKARGPRRTRPLEV